MEFQDTKARRLEERSKGLYRALKHPLVYDAAMQMLGGPGVMDTWISSFLDVRTGMRLLDVGSGTSDILNHLTGVSYVGLEPNRAYVQAATERWGANGTFLCGGIQDMEGLSGHFDRVIAIGVLHHVSDPIAAQFFLLAKRLVHPQGMIVTLDPAFVPNQSLASRMLVSCDRGGHVRSTRGYGALAAQAGLDTQLYYANRLLRIPYSHVTTVSRRVSGLPAARSDKAP